MRNKLDLIPEGTDPEIVVAIDAVHSAENVSAELDIKVQRLSKALLDDEVLEERAALAAEQGNATDYVALAEKIEKQRQELDRARLAQRAAAAVLQEAREHLHKLGRQGFIKMAKKFSGQRAKAAQKMQDAIAQLAQSYREFHEINNRVRLSWPSGTIPNGCLLGANEVSRIIAEELARAVPVEPLKAGIPSLPGAAISPTNPAKLPTLAETVEAANAYMVQKIEAVPSAPEPAAQPVSIVADPIGFVPPSPALTISPTKSAAELQAAMGGKRRLA